MLFVGIFIGLLAGYCVVTLLQRRRPTPIPTEIEFWVYLTTEKLPGQDELMTELSKAEALGPPELLLFSDIRLHVALALRSKNLEQFRPDLADSRVEPTAEMLAILSESTALARVRYSADGKLRDDRQLRLVPYLAYALAEKAGAKLILDVSASRLMMIAEFESIIKSDRRLQQPRSHVRVTWQPQEIGGYAETRGFGKKGLADLRTLPVRQDQRVLVVALLEDAVSQVWQLASLPTVLKVFAHEDEFNLTLGPASHGISLVRIARIHPA